MQEGSEGQTFMRFFLFGMHDSEIYIIWSMMFLAYVLMSSSSNDSQQMQLYKVINYNQLVHISI